MSLIRARYRAVNTIMNLPRGGYVGLLDLYPNAAAAYSLRKLRAAYSGSAVRVMRSSDYTEQDIGFTAQGELDTTALTTFVNADVNLFTSDYSSGGVAEPTRNNFTVTIDETKDGKTECLKAVWDGTSPAQLFKFNFLPIEQGVTFDISAEFYLEGFASVSMGANGNFGDLNFTTNEWATYTQTITVNNTSDDFVVSINGGTNGSTIWLKNIVITQTTADGHVTTWYDQSLSNDATQTTAANQPKIVSAGSLVTENGKVAIDFDGVNDEIGFLSDISATEVSSVIVAKAITNNINDRFFGWRNSSHSFLSVLMQGVNQTALRGLSQTSDATQNLSYVGVDYTNQSIISMYNASVWRINGNEFTTATVAPSTGVRSSNGLTLGSRGGGSNNGNIRFQEGIFYPSDQSANRTGIEGSINEYYNIY